RRVRLPSGLSGRAVLARLARSFDPRRHQPDHADDRRAGSAAAMNDDVLIRREGAVSHISLNRPKALHALTQAMCEAISAALLEWRDDDRVAAVILDHAEGRGFCAGGDVAMVRRSALEDGGEAGRAFFHAEYRMNH